MPTLTSIVKPRTMPGVLELLPLEQVAFQSMVDTVRAGFERFGFLPIETPAMEFTDILLTKTGGETERQVFFVQSTGARAQGREPQLALRFDLTVPLARYVAEHEAELSFPFRRYQIQSVFRGESPQQGRFREFVQCDIDVVGRDTLDLGYDAEIPAVIASVFTDLAIGPFTIRINNRKVLRGLLEERGVDDPDEQSAMLREIDKLDKRGPEAVAESVASLGLPSAEAAELVDLISTRPAGHQDAASLLDRIKGDNPTLLQGIAELRRVLEGVASQRVPADRYALDLSIARGLDYYTGTVYETSLDQHEGIGSICSGGRYDDLAGHYTQSRLPGVGISIGLTRLYWQLREAGLVSAGRSSVGVLVTVMDSEGFDNAIGIGSRLRAAGISTEVVLEPAKLGRQLKYADRVGIGIAVIAGSQERARSAVVVRDMIAQTQNEVAEDILVEEVRRLLASRERIEL
jgi:histidyl-tRNA synthetase